jgi:DNA repair exonuclease SbcCD ATPase subunit
MANISETGHAKNVANFENLITNITGFGTVYNPSKESIKLSALNAQLAYAKNAIGEVNSTEPAYKNAVSAREAAFTPLNKLITRVINSLKASDSSSQVDDSAMTLVRKLQGRRATPKLTDDEKKAIEAEGKEVNQISSSQMSYDSRLDNFDKLIKLLASEPEYSPNEPDITIEALTSLYNDLSSKNAAVISATVPLNNARISRDQVLYTPLTGIVDISVDVKTYVKSIFGATSPQYKLISKLELKSIKS